MANSGKDSESNKSQFFITYSKQVHLDGKHTIFGKVIDGADSTLDAMERVPVNGKNRPLNEIKITGASRHNIQIVPISHFLLGDNSRKSNRRRRVGQLMVRIYVRPRGFFRKVKFDFNKNLLYK